MFKGMTSYTTPKWAGNSSGLWFDPKSHQKVTLGAFLILDSPKQTKCQCMTMDTENLLLLFRNWDLTAHLIEGCQTYFGGFIPPLFVAALGSFIHWNLINSVTQWLISVFCIGGTEKFHTRANRLHQLLCDLLQIRKTITCLQRRGYTVCVRACACASASGPRRIWERFN